MLASSKIVPMHDKIMRHVREDDVMGLKLLLTPTQHVHQEYFHHALRLSAQCGAIQCLNYILSTGLANILEPERHSKKIALHYALEQEHLDCAIALLRATDMLDFFDPAGQLLFGEEPNRPIDVIDRMDDDIKKFNIVESIQSVLRGYHGVNSDQKQQDEIATFFQDLCLEKLYFSL
jgi:hypothetical protein